MSASCCRVPDVKVHVMPGPLHAHVHLRGDPALSLPRRNTLRPGQAACCACRPARHAAPCNCFEAVCCSGMCGVDPGFSVPACAGKFYPPANGERNVPSKNED